MKHSGRGTNRRDDKIRIVETHTAIGPPVVEKFVRTESKLQRKARLGRLTIKH